MNRGFVVYIHGKLTEFVEAKNGPKIRYIPRRWGFGHVFILKPSSLRYSKWFRDV